MSKGPRISQEINNLIWGEAIANPKKPRFDLALELQKRIERMG